jgi:UDP-N-acetylmuramyl pentapeptide synthase
MKILILDTVHGGGVLADRYPQKDDEVTCVDVYKVTPYEELERLRCKGYNVSTEVPKEEYDLVIMPIHCPDKFLDGVKYKERKFFSQAVNELIDDKRFRIEVTGVKGKTSFCCLLAHILTAANKKVFLHTSRGRGEWENGKLVVKEKLSIAPPLMLTIPDSDHDVIICEVSLGGSGKADISCITNLLEDYPIAAGTRKAFDGKKSILSDTNIVPENEIDLWKSCGTGQIIGYGKKIKVLNEPVLGDSVKIHVDYEDGFETDLKGSYLALEYLDAMEMVIEVCKTMKISKSFLQKGLSSFEGVPGRGEVSFNDGKWIIKERNPGISERSVERTYATLYRMNSIKGAIAVLDPVNRKVCSKMDSEAIKEISQKYGIKLIVTDGSGTIPELPKSDGPTIFFIKEGYT